MATLSLAAPSPVRTNDQAISGLARLLATENIRVEHQPVRTAYFDTATRTLTLPIWRGMSADLYDMLVGHEVGHALWTPASDAVVMAAIARCRAAGAPSDQYAKSILNIVEDARIERKIKEKFPGLRRNFVIAYRELIARDIFGLSSVGNDPNARGLVDRFNLYHKCGALGLMQVDFTPAEQVLVARGATIETFEDTVALCEAILRHLSQNGENNEPQDGDENGAGKPGNGKQGENGPEGQPGDDDGEGAEADGSSPNGQPGEDQGEDGEPSDAQAPQGDGKDGDAQSKPQNGKPDSKPQDADGKPQNAGEQTGKEDTGKGRKASEGADLGTVTTDNALNDGLGKMADTKNGNYYNQYGEAPKFVMDRLVIPATHIIKLWQKEWAKAPQALPLIDSMIELWKRDNNPTVVNMVKRFEQRKAADDAKRTMTAKSGRIDTSRLAYYKVSEDLFLSMTTTTDGKSHGLVMVIDWSGSMSGVLGSVISQVLCLVEFCRKTGVPYEVYAFSDCCQGWDDGKDKHTDKDGYYSVSEQLTGHLSPNGFRMVQFLRSGLSRADHADAVRGMVGLMLVNGYEPFNAELRTRVATVKPNHYGYGHYDDVRVLAPGFSYPMALTLNGTPLNEALLACADITEAFRKRTGAQIVNLAVLTDGEATRSVSVYGAKKAGAGYAKDAQGWDRYPSTVLRWGTKQYNFTDTSGGRWGRQCETESLIRYLRDRTGARVYGFFLMGDKTAQRYVKGSSIAWKSPAQQAAAVAQMDAEGSAVVPHAAYDEFYIVGIATRTESEDFMDRLDASALSQRKIASSFVKGMQGRSTTRTIMVRFADCFATGKPSQHNMK
jgi:hypothetical protein